MDGHYPVMLAEAVDLLNVRAGGRYVDGTFGRGGHSREIARRGGRVLGIDRDERALAAGEALEAETEGAVRVVRGDHGNLRRIANECGWNEVDGVLLDLGVSSPQLDEAGRGFSFQREGPLDMRMDRSAALTAAELVNTRSAEELERIFREYGEEPQARRIARAVAAEAKAGRSFETTTELAEFVERTVGRKGAHHPATRVFQALRMEVNDELGELRRALEGGLALIRPGGRFAVITFESLSDRIVKRTFADHVGRMVSLQQGGEEWHGEFPRAKAVTRKAVVASEKELEENCRSRSAKLRVIEITGGMNQ